MEFGKRRTYVLPARIEPANERGSDSDYPKSGHRCIDGPVSPLRADEESVECLLSAEEREAEL